MLYKPKKVLDYDQHDGWGICLWQLPNGSYIQDINGDYLSCGPCVIGNKQAEKNMVGAAASMGVKDGRPFWLPGFRKITGSEWEDQMERLMDGKVPDAADLFRQASEGGIIV